jgi:hypothetical protein
MFEVKFLRDWEEKADNTKSWNAMKEYFTKEYRAIKKYQPNKQAFESMRTMLRKGKISLLSLMSLDVKPYPAKIRFSRWRNRFKVQPTQCRKSWTD